MSGKKRKIVIYQKTNRPILMHDNGTKTDDQLQKDLESCMISKTVHTFKTETDILIIRPSEISSILVTKDEGQIKNFYKTELEKEDDKK